MERTWRRGCWVPAGLVLKPASAASLCMGFVGARCSATRRMPPSRGGAPAAVFGDVDQAGVFGDGRDEQHLVVAFAAQLPLDQRHAVGVLRGPLALAGGGDD